MPPPGQSELAGADHTHGGPQIWNPYWSFGSELGCTIPTVSVSLWEYFEGIIKNNNCMNKIKKLHAHLY